MSNEKEIKKAVSNKLFGTYEIEHVIDEKDRDLGYLLHGPKVTYTLMRYINTPQYLYALNSRFNICSIKGNYTFTDKDGKLVAVS